jgi:hypothetical protein
MGIENVISTAKTLPRGNPSPFPAMYWRANGESYIANTGSEIEEGSTPYHPDNAPAKAETPSEPQKAGAPTLTKEETILQLQAGQIEHDPALSHKKLYVLLLSGIKNALTAANIEHDATSTDAKALLELFPKD